MPTYEAFLPSHCTIRYRLTVDEPIADEQELKQKMLEEGGPHASLCHHCADGVDLDPSALNDEAAGKLEFEVWEVE